MKYRYITIGSFLLLLSFFSSCSKSNTTAEESSEQRTVVTKTTSSEISSELLRMLWMAGYNESNYESRFVEDLGMDEADYMSFLMNVEDEFQVTLGIYNLSGIRTVNDLARLIMSIISPQSRTYSLNDTFGDNRLPITITCDIQVSYQNREHSIIREVSCSKEDCHVRLSSQDTTVTNFQASVNSVSTTITGSSEFTICIRLTINYQTASSERISKDCIYEIRVGLMTGIATGQMISCQNASSQSDDIDYSYLSSLVNMNIETTVLQSIEDISDIDDVQLNLSLQVLTIEESQMCEIIRLISERLHILIPEDAIADMQLVQDLRDYCLAQVQSRSNSFTESEVCEGVIECMSDVLDLPNSSIHLRDKMTDLGSDSLDFLYMAYQLEERFGIHIDNYYIPAFYDRDVAEFCRFVLTYPL